MIYLDNNATTMMSADTQKEMLRWCNRGNPSSGHETAEKSRQMMSKFREALGAYCGVTSCCDEDRDNQSAEKIRANPSAYKLIYTSGASEANSTLIQMVTSAYAHAKSTIPHVVASAIEHKSIIMQLESFAARKLITYTLVQPDAAGFITPAAVEKAIRKNTCLVAVMHANNETGVINDIGAIGAVSHKHGVPFHADVVQTFGKLPINLLTQSVDSFSVSFHKLYGPPGIGILGIKQQMILGYKPLPVIFGVQNDHYRGGTENIPAIGAAYYAFENTIKNRPSKNSALLELKRTIYREISARMPACTLVEYKARAPGAKLPSVETVFISPIDGCLNSTILLSLVKRGQPRVCNSKMRKWLEKQKIIVSIGSACNTASAKASHVLYALGVDDLVRAGALRISMSDHTTLADVKTFIVQYIAMVNAMS